MLNDVKLSNIVYLYYNLKKFKFFWPILYWDYISKLISKTTDIRKKYNLLVSKTIDILLLGIFVLIITNFILLCQLL